MASVPILLRAAKSYASNMLGSPSPFFISHIVTLDCNMRCNYCTFWRETKKEKPLSKEEVFDFLGQCKKMGSVIYGMSGGEPLLRKDLPEIMEYSKKIGLINSITTNGLLFEKRLPEILPFLDHVGISLDAFDERHAKIRGLKEKNLHEKIISAIELASGQKKLGVDINTVISGANLDQIVPLVKFAKEHGTTISLQPLIEGPFTPEWLSLKKKQQEFKKTIAQLLLLKKKNYPILNSNEFLKIIMDRKPWDCRVGRFMLEITPSGRVIFPCGSMSLAEGGIQDTTIGSIREKPLKEIWHSKEAQALRAQARTCRRNTECYLNCYVEMSLLITKSWNAFNYFRFLGK